MGVEARLPTADGGGDAVDGDAGAVLRVLLDGGGAAEAVRRRVRGEVPTGTAGMKFAFTKF